jgi:hypothetical protein
MDQALRVAQDVAALVSAVCHDFHVALFDTIAHVVPAPAETTHSGWEAAFRMYKANGGTSVGAPLVRLTKDGRRVEEIIVITDGGENARPFFREAYAEYVARIGVSPHVVVVAVGGDCQHFVRELEAVAIPVTLWTFGGDYYSLPNLLPLLALPSREDLVEAIMAVPLPVRPLERMTA